MIRVIITLIYYVLVILFVAHVTVDKQMVDETNPPYYTSKFVPYSEFGRGGPGLYSSSSSSFNHKVEVGRAGP